MFWGNYSDFLFGQILKNNPAIWSHWLRVTFTKTNLTKLEKPDPTQINKPKMAPIKIISTTCYSPKWQFGRISVTGLVHFWKVLSTNFLAKIGQYLATFWAFLKKSHFQGKLMCLLFDQFLKIRLHCISGRTAPIGSITFLFGLIDYVWLT